MAVMGGRWNSGEEDGGENSGSEGGGDSGEF